MKRRREALSYWDDDQIAKRQLAQVQQNRKQYFAGFPEPILLHLFKFLDPDSLLQACRVCKLWNTTASDNSLWQSRYEQSVIVTPNFGDTQDSLKRLGGSYKRLYLTELMHAEDWHPDKEIVIATNHHGFRLSDYDDHELFGELRLGGVVKDVGIDGLIPDSFRDLTALILMVKKGHKQGRYPNLEIVKIPNEISFRIRRNPFSGSELIEEKHRLWKPASSRRTKANNHTEVNPRTRQIIVDVSARDGLHMGTKAWRRLKELTNCWDNGQLQTIPRDHPSLLQVFYEFQGTSEAESLRLISIPIGVRWHLETKHGLGSEYVSESYRRWPDPSPQDMSDMPFCKLQHIEFPPSQRGTYVISNIEGRTEWDEEAKKFPKGAEEKEETGGNGDDFDLLTEYVAEAWA